MSPHQPAATAAPESTAPAMARLFLALWPNEAELAGLRRHASAWHWRPGSALVRPDRLHLTLHFIGPVPRERLATLGTALRVPHEPFSLQFDQPALWHRGLAVLCASEVPAGLVQLHAALAEVLGELQLPVETRPLVPHVTLARHAGGSVPPAPPAALRWEIREYLLVESVLGQGVDYRVLHRYPPGA